MSAISLAHGFSRHTKIASLSDLAFRIWVAGIERADEQLTDGLLKKDDLDLLPKMPATKRAREAVIAELVAAKLWIVVGDKWQIHDFLEWQDSSAVARRKRDAARERMRRSRLSGSQIVRANETRTESEQFYEQNENVSGTFAVGSPNVLGGAPAQALSLISSGSLFSPDSSALSASSEEPDPLGAREPAVKKSGPKKWRIVPADWQPTDEHREIATERGVDFELELAKFRDHEFRDPKTDANRTFRNWMRSARPTLKPGFARRGGPPQPDHGLTGWEGQDQ